MSNNDNRLVKYGTLRKAWGLWGLANLFFAFQFIARLAPGVLREEIMHKFAVDIAGFGTLSGCYYLGYSSLQIPLGMMLDRLNFRFVTSLSIATTALGIIIFGQTHSWEWLLFARFLTGVGSGVAFLTIAKITKIFFAEKYHSLLLGLAVTFGLMGAVFGVVPMQFLFNYFGYERTFTILAAMAIMVAISMYIFGQINITVTSDQNQGNIFYLLKTILCNPKIILAGIAGGLMVGTLEGFADVWAMVFFNQVYGFSTLESATVTSFIYIGMCVGGPLLALIAHIFKSNHSVIFLSGTFTVLALLMLLYGPALTLMQSTVLMFIVGILCCYQVLVFAVVSNYVSPSLAGLAIAVTNCLNMSFGHLFHAMIGKAFASSWNSNNGVLDSLGNPIYSIDHFIYGLSVIPICCFIGQMYFGYLMLKAPSDKFAQKDTAIPQ